MKPFYISFGQVHVHSVAGKTLDKDTIAVINADNYAEAREKAFEIFGNKFSFAYEELPDMSYFPKGLVNI